MKRFLLKIRKIKSYFFRKLELVFLYFYGLNFKSFGRNNKIWFPVKILGKKHISIGNNCGINSFIHIWGHGGLTIGNNVMIAASTSISTLTHNYDSESMRFSPIVFKSVLIEDDVWIGTGVIILPGVTIRKGAVVGAGSIVTKDIPERAIVIGNPARIVKYRKK